MRLFGVNMPVCGDQTTLPAIAELKRRNVWTSLWFVQDGGKAAKYRDSGCDAFVTDHVTRVRKTASAFTLTSTMPLGKSVTSGVSAMSK